MPDNPLVGFHQPTLIARFLRREKRFLVEVEAEADNSRFWAHSNNSGSMMGLLRPGNRVILSKAAANARRKLGWTLEFIELDGMWVGVNTLTPNRLLRAAHTAGRLPFAEGYTSFRSEARTGESRLDGLFTCPDSPELPDLWVEAKNVTLVEEETAYFPDAQTARGRKHLQELMDIVSRGSRAACFFLVQRNDAQCFGPADFIDPDYAELFWQALKTGVEMCPWRASLTPGGVDIDCPLPLAKPRK